LKHKSRPNLTSHWQPWSQAHWERAGRSFTYTPPVQSLGFKNPGGPFWGPRDWLYLWAIRASPNGAQYVTPDSKIHCEKVKMCRFSSRNWFFCTKFVLACPWVVNDATQLCTSKNECNKLDLTAAQYFWLVDHNDWSRLLAISSPHLYAVPVTVLLVGLPK
jgi:hypothetical protein